MKLRVLPVLAMAASLLFSCDPTETGLGKDKEPVFSITPKTIDIQAESCVFGITIISTVEEYEVTIVGDWISEFIRLGDRKKGETIRFQASANDSYEERSGIVSICTSGGSCVPVTIRQAGKTPKFVHHNMGYRFTGTWCGWCPYMDEAFHTVAGDASKRFDYIAFHAGDAMEISAGSKLFTYYKAQGYPTCVLNGWKEIENDTDISSIANTIKTSIGDFEKDFTSDAGIGITSSLTDDQLSIKATVRAAEGEYLISAFLLESGIVESQAHYYLNGNGGVSSEKLKDFVHDNVARKLLSKDATGDAFTATKEESVFEWDVTLNSSWNKDKLSVAVIVLRSYGAESAKKAQSNYPDTYMVNSLIVPVGTTKELEYAN